MRLLFKDVKPCVRFASVIVKRTDYPEFLYAYDYRLFYMLSGNIDVVFHNKTINLTDGDLLIFPPGVAYKIILNTESSKHIILNFDFDFKACDKRSRAPQPENAFEKEEIRSNAYYPPFDEIFKISVSYDFEDDLRLIISEVDKQDEYSKESVSALMKHLLIKILRASEKEANTSSQKLCDDVMRHVKAHYAEDMNNISIAEKFNYHPYYLNSVFTKICGVTLNKYITHVRLEKAKKMLLRTEDSIGDIAEKCGFKGQSYFTECFNKAYGKSPKEYRNQGK